MKCKGPFYGSTRGSEFKKVKLKTEKLKTEINYSVISED